MKNGKKSEKKRALIFEQLQELLADKLVLDFDRITMQSSFVDDFDADSLDMIEILSLVEDSYPIPEIQQETAVQIRTVGDLVCVIEQYVD